MPPTGFYFWTPQCYGTLAHYSIGTKQSASQLYRSLGGSTRMRLVSEFPWQGHSALNVLIVG